MYSQMECPSLRKHSILRKIQRLLTTITKIERVISECHSLKREKDYRSQSETSFRLTNF